MARVARFVRIVRLDKRESLQVRDAIEADDDLKDQGNIVSGFDLSRTILTNRATLAGH